MLNGLTLLRAGAALWVFAFHIYIREPFDIPIVSNILGNGAVAMTFFFVLSGFVLSYVYNKRDVTYSIF